MNERIALYSESLYRSACEEGVAEAVYESLKAIEKVICENMDYVKLMSSAELKADERENLVHEAFFGRVHEFCLNFMKILAKRRIFEILIPCIKEFEKNYLKDNHIENVNIVTAISIDDEKKKSVIEKLSRLTGKKINATFTVREDIIGGIIVESETEHIDASVLGKLKGIERYISKN